MKFGMLFVKRLFHKISRMIKIITKPILILTFFVLFGCQDIIECVINTHPILPNSNFQSGRVDHFYSDSIRAEIKNNANDDGFFYYFSIEGALPEGLDFYVEHRTLIIEGVPLDRGRFHFIVRLYVESDEDYFNDCENRLNDCDGLCEDSTVEDYYIEVF